jgi:hypothetical protein
MVSTGIRNTYNKSNFKYHEGTVYLTNAESPLSWNVSLRKEPYPNSSKFVDLRSENKKLLVTLNNGMFHFWYDTVGALLGHLKENSNTELILDTSYMRIGELADNDIDDASFFTFFLQMLKDMNVRYQLINYSMVPGIIINNFFYHHNGDRINNSPQLVYEAITPYLNNQVEPYRKVYISRKMIDRSTPYDNTIKPGLSFINDQRIDDEELLESFLSANGIEIVVPESFDNFIDQINYFNTVKTAISITSSGLTNSIFMPPENNIVEFVTPLIATSWYDHEADAWDAEEALHHLYELIAFHKKHKHLAIANNNRNAQELIDYIKKHNLMEKIHAL